MRSSRQNVRLWGAVRGFARATRLPVLAAAGTLIAVGLAVAWLGQRADAQARAMPGVTWTLSPAANTVTIRLTPGSGPSGRQLWPAAAWW